MDQAERREFVRKHRTSVFGYGRRADGPAMSIVYYVMDGDDILVSSMAARGKARAIGRNGKVSLCILDEQWPPTYLQVYADAVIERDFDKTVDLMLRIAGVMAGKPMPESLRPLIEKGAKLEDRVVLRSTPYASFETPPKHVHDADDVSPKLRHSTGITLPWR